MKTEEITAGNITIAEFMGCEFGHGFYAGKGDYYFPDEKVTHLPSELKYHSSWDWLMPAVEKISEYKYEDEDTAYPRTFGMISIEDGSRMVRFNRCIVFHGKTLIEATWLAVVDFIQKNTPNKPKS